MRKKNKEINVFSTSAIDLFASSLGVFIILVIIIIPFYRKKSVAIPRPTDFKKIEQELKETKKVVKEKERKIEKIEEELKNLTVVKNENKELKEEIVVLNQRIPKNDPTKKITEQKKVINKLQKKVKKVTDKNVVAEKHIKKVKKKVKRITQEKLITQKELKKLKKEQVIIEKDRDKNQVDLQAALKIIRELEARYKLGGSFIAIIVKWSTRSHDIDLVVHDPKGKTFNFKNRSFKGHPGIFSLDSRTGPGAELWQSPELLPGRYKMTYKFYNNYGNNAPANVTGTIFTKEGSVELPAIKMDFTKSRTQSFVLDVSEDRKITLRN